MKKSRQESDSLGTIEVPADKLWGAQTQRALENFKIGWHTLPTFFIHQYALIKKACAVTNRHLGKLDADISHFITQACDEIIEGQHDDQFPLPVWQTGSGTQTNMNLNEVIANRASELAGGKRGEKSPVHPNDHVNLSQSTNDTFPTAMHVAGITAVRGELLPALEKLVTSLEQKEQEFEKRIKSGRTHMMDATPVTLGQEFSGYRAQIQHGRQQLLNSLPAAQALAIGGSAVGTGLNTHPDWAQKVCKEIAKLSGIEFTSADNKFAGLAGHEAVVDLHNAVKTLATSLFKIANDLRLMASGPRCGLAEIQLPANEPGSSIMPGKVNPTQIEALTQAALRIMGNDTVIAMANSQGQFELNVYKPLMAYTLLESVYLLADISHSFVHHCLDGITANDAKLDQYMENSLMLVTALTPHIGYDKAAQAAKYAHQKNRTLKEAVVALKLLSEKEFDEKVRPEAMLSP